MGKQKGYKEIVVSRKERFLLIELPTNDDCFEFGIELIKTINRSGYYYLSHRYSANSIKKKVNELSKLV